MSGWWRPLALGLAAAALCSGAALAQPLAERIKLCAACHGEDGNSRRPNIPSLAGQPQFFLVSQIFLFREGVRKVDEMTPMVKDLNDQDLVAMAKYFSGLKARPSEEMIDPALVKRGAALAGPRRCASCHLPDLTGQDQIPRLAGQRVDYMIHALKQFRDDRRSGADTHMSNVTLGIPDHDLAALAHYAAAR